MTCLSWWFRLALKAGKQTHVEGNVDLLAGKGTKDIVARALAVAFLRLTTPRYVDRRR